MGAHLYTPPAILTESEDNEGRVVRLLLFEEFPRAFPYDKTYPLYATLRVAPLIVHSHPLFFDDDHPRLKRVES